MNSSFFNRNNGSNTSPELNSNSFRQHGSFFTTSTPRGCSTGTQNAELRSTFGTTPQPARVSFGRFEQNTPSTSTFNELPSVGTRGVRFTPTTVSEILDNITGNLHSISKNFDDKSFEELRFEDYQSEILERSTLQSSGNQLRSSPRKTHSIFSVSNVPSFSTSSSSSSSSSSSPSPQGGSNSAPFKLGFSTTPQNQAVTMPTSLSTPASWNLNFGTTPQNQAVTFATTLSNPSQENLLNLSFGAAPQNQAVTPTSLLTLSSMNSSFGTVPQSQTVTVPASLSSSSQANLNSTPFNSSFGTTPQNQTVIPTSSPTPASLNLNFGAVTFPASLSNSTQGSLNSAPLNSFSPTPQSQAFTFSAAVDNPTNIFTSNSFPSNQQRQEFNCGATSVGNPTNTFGNNSFPSTLTQVPFSFGTTRSVGQNPLSTSQNATPYFPSNKQPQVGAPQRVDPFLSMSSNSSAACGCSNVTSFPSTYPTSSFTNFCANTITPSPDLSLPSATTSRSLCPDHGTNINSVGFLLEDESSPCPFDTNVQHYTRLETNYSTDSFPHWLHPKLQKVFGHTCKPMRTVYSEMPKRYTAVPSRSTEKSDTFTIPKDVFKELLQCKATPIESRKRLVLNTDRLQASNSKSIIEIISERQSSNAENSSRQYRNEEMIHWSCETVNFP